MSGIVGVVSERDCLDDMFYPTDYHTHLGTQYGGIAVNDGERTVRRVHSIKNSQFKSNFGEDVEFQSFRGNKGLGVISDRDYQPLIARLKFGKYALVGAGYIDNQEQLAAELTNKGHSFVESHSGEINQLELVSKLIDQGDDLVDGINKMNDQIDGSMSLLVLGDEGIYAARAKYGHTPLVLGEKTTEGKRSMIVALESSSFKNSGFKKKRYLGPNEVVFIDESGEKTIQEAGEESQLCTFLNVYTGFPAAAIYPGRSVVGFRLDSGGIMAKREDRKVDGVWGAQDSGVIYAFGFANNSKVPLLPITFKYTPGYGRSYTPPTKKMRDFIALMKQVAIEDEERLVEGKEIVITEDSIVRGTQLKNFYLAKIWQLGVKGIHVRPACPPLMWPCKYLFSTRSMDELFARTILFDMHGRHLSDDEVKPYIDCDSGQFREMITAMEKDMKDTSLKAAGLEGTGRNFSLRYQRLDDMVVLTGKPKEDLCTYCWDGCQGPCKK